MYPNPPDAYDWYRQAQPVEQIDAAESGDDLDKESLRPSGFAEWFALGLLFLPGIQAYRLPLRVGAYAISLYAFAMWWFGRGSHREAKHPGERFLVLVSVVLALGLAHPLTSNLQSGLAQIALYFAIFCPL